MREIVGLLRRAMARQIVWRGEQKPTCWGEAARNEARVRQLADAHGDVDALFERIDETVVEQKFDLQVRRAAEEVGDRAAR